MVFVTTDQTTERLLIDSVSRLDVLALSTRLTCVMGVYRHYDPPGAFSLVQEQ